MRLSGAAALASVGDAEALAGANRFALQGADETWEILTAAHAELIGERTYRLSRFLRGLAGSEEQASRTVAPGALLVRLDDGAVGPLVDSVEEVGRTWRYRIGPANRDPADPSMTELVATAGWTALRPFAPVRLRARRAVDGVHLTWIRRTRRDGDGWEPVDVPLAEETEAYAVDLLAPDGSVLRSLAATTPEVLYPAAAEIADFGAAQAALRLRVAQLSAVAGRGFAAQAVVNVT